jgi:hypothetical protein
MNIINENMEDKKYYIPEIEEFHYGFIFEYFNGQEYEKRISSLEGPFRNNPTKFFDSEKDKFRVKYLDKEDIESLGFKFVKEDKFSKYFKFQNFKLQTVENGTHGIYIAELDEDGHTLVFRGIIKNKSELKRILKQIGICQ